MNSKRIFISNAIFVFFLTMVVFSQGTVSPSAKYHSTSNAITKRSALRELGAPGPKLPANADVSATAKPTMAQEDVSLLQEALSDSDPTVVEQAVRRIGELRVVQLNNAILDVYGKSDAKYGGYSERVKLSVIDAIGDIGLLDNAKFLDSKILQEIRAPYIHNILQATKKLHATSTIPSLQKLINDYTLKCQRLENAHANPLLLSSLQLTLEEAKIVLTSLTTNN
jgi:hypothetical protein